MNIRASILATSTRQLSHERLATLCADLLIALDRISEGDGKAPFELSEEADTAIRNSGFQYEVRS